jgi:DNA-binding transcriptional ArsR family regulator
MAVRQKMGQALVDPALVKAMTHPTRMHALITLNKGAAAASEIADELDRPVRHVEYHLRKLLQIGAIEEAGERTAPNRRKVVAYRAVVRPWIHTEEWAQVDPDAQAGPTAAIFDNMNQDLAKAILGGTVNDRGNHISRTPLLLDGQGFAEVVEVLDGALGHLLEIGEMAAGRLAAGAEVVSTKVHMIQVASPEAEEQTSP